MRETGRSRAGNPGPFAEALRHAEPLTSAKPNQLDQRGATGLQVLVDRFRAESGGRAVGGVLPVQVAFPEFGPLVFLASELTAEMQPPSVDLTFRRTK